MARNALLGIPVLISMLLIFFPVLNPDQVPVRAESCGEYCERGGDCQQIIAAQQLVRIPAQPLNTWSNLAFLIAGFFVFRKRKTLAGTWFAVSCVILGLGSGAFHSFMTQAGQRWDVLGMFLVFNFLAVYAMLVTQKYDKYYWAVGLSVAISLVLHLFFVDLSSTIVLAVASTIIVVHMGIAVINDRLELKRMGLTLVPFAIAIVFRQLDVNGILCYPNSILYQGHAVWHVLAAFGIFLIFRVFEELRYEDLTRQEIFG